MSTQTNGFAQGTVLRVAYSMLAMTSSVILARVGLNVLRPKGLTASDYFVFLAFSVRFGLAVLSLFRFALCLRPGLRYLRVVC